MQAKFLYDQDNNGGTYPTPPSQPQSPGLSTPPSPPSYNTGNTGGSASSNSIIALVLGILSWIMCGILAAIPAWIIGKKEVNAIDEGRSPAAGRTMAVIGMWLGIIQTIVGIIAIIALAILFALGMLGGILDSLN
ncbi:MAG: DUF4190 domain-containing protein [Ignavibacteriaceae bacterium]|nr:DUF4190 domain-containing protein [Ignavibacteriaceae bacterium]